MHEINYIFIKMHFFSLFFLIKLFYSVSLKINLNYRYSGFIPDIMYNKKDPINPYGKKYYDELLRRRKLSSLSQKKYPVSPTYYEEQLKRLNSNDAFERDRSILGDNLINESEVNSSEYKDKFRIILSRDNLFGALGINMGSFEEEHGNMWKDFNRDSQTKKLKSSNFEVVTNFPYSFKDIGGYSNVKLELYQCIDLLKNFSKYERFNVRIPKGLILEGPPGTGKTLIAKGLAGEAKCSFIAVSGSDFQDKYVGVGSSRIKELFELANKNSPCIIFFDEVDALGRKRSTDGESSSNERDTTLNALLVELDGFKNNSNVFIVCATNRIDLLDNALTRPGRIDKKIFIGPPDKDTRREIFNIHIKGKPFDTSICLDDLIEITEGITGAQIENLLNEAMLNALRENKEEFSFDDFNLVLNKMMVGWQPNDHIFSKDIVEHISIHEMGHAILGILSTHHSKMSKVVINLSSPRSPGYTVFESSKSNIYTRESLFEHLMILLGGRIAEELFYGGSVTTGAINDFEEALKLAEKMVVYYGMGTNIIYPSYSDKFKELIDNDVIELINRAYTIALGLLEKAKPLIKETSEYLITERLLTFSYLNELIDRKYSYLKEEKF